eukprot:ANDGO_01025.mRNA.1 putative dolichyl pyrophosphate Man9GlcNAc2 alpha-1
MLSKRLVLLAVSIGILVRVLVSQHPHSGKSKGPMYGDFEAQRHWMEVTMHVPVAQWYTFDLPFWGLDYPPVQAFHAWVCGKMGSLYNPAWFALNSSRGLESADLVVFMRATSVLSDLICFFPPAILLVLSFQRSFFPRNQLRGSSSSVLETETINIYVLLKVLMMLLAPGLLQIDHAHFQYNSLSLGFTLWAVYFFGKRWFGFASVAYCIALNSKQVALFYAPAIFFYVLGNISKQKSSGLALGMFLKVASAVTLTFLACWAPFYVYGDGIPGVMQGISRLFPVNRGLFEDKVANFWCSISLFTKVQLLDRGLMFKICTASTLCSFLVSVTHLYRAPSLKNLMCSMLISSVSFFLFSYQVHEKGILFPLVPLILLSDYWSTVWIPATYVSVASFSMFPLAVKDNQIALYFGLQFLWWTLVVCTARFEALVAVRSFGAQHVGAFEKQQVRGMLLAMLAGAMMIFFHGMHYSWSPPAQYPDLVTMFFTVSSCIWFFVLLADAYALQLWNMSGVELAIKVWNDVALQSSPPKQKMS